MCKIPHDSMMQKCCDLYAILIFTLSRYSFTALNESKKKPSAFCFSFVFFLLLALAAFFFLNVVFLSFGFEFSVGRVRRSYSLSLFFISGYGVCYTPRRHQNCSPFFRSLSHRHPLSVSVAVLLFYFFALFRFVFGVSQ